MILCVLESKVNFDRYLTRFEKPRKGINRAYEIFYALFWRLVELIKLLFQFQGSCRVLTHLSKKTAKLNRSASPEKPNAVLPVIPIDEADRRKALYTGIAGADFLCYERFSYVNIYAPTEANRVSFSGFFLGNLS